MRFGRLLAEAAAGFICLSSAAADVGIWNHVVNLNGGAGFYGAPSKMTVDKATRTLSLHMLINEPSTKRIAKTDYRSVVLNYTADCSKETGLMTKVEWYSGEYGSGKVVRTERPSGTEPMDKSRPYGAVALALCHETFR